MGNQSVPSKSWALRDWLTEAGVQRDVEVIDTAQALKVTVQRWDSARLSEWLGNSQRHTPGLPNQTTAIQMMTVLHHIAKRNGKKLFTREDFLEHANIFLMSDACKFIPTPLTTQDVWDIIGDLNDQPDMPSTIWAFELRRRVYPTPPTRLFGREQKQEYVLSSLLEHEVVILAGVGGEGKTALGWHAAVQAVREGICHEMAWFTDKRYLINIDGKRENIPGTPSDQDFFITTLRELARRFNWSDAFAADDAALVSRCADHLRRGSYLVVIDNLETVEASETVAGTLMDMVTPTGRERVGSRIILTSRQRVESMSYRNVMITGLDQAAGRGYLSHLNDIWNPMFPIPESLEKRLITSTHGNPLLLTLVARRWAQRPALEMIEETISGLEGGTDSMFSAVFTPLLEALPPEAPVLARYIAHHCIEDMRVDYPELRELYLYSRLETPINELITLLVKNCVLSAAGGNTYTMHPLVRAFFIGQGS